MSETYDVVIVGGGPAGLSGALNLGRGCRRVLLCDGERRRNIAAEHIHGFVTREGITPTEFRAIAREQLAPYDVTVRDVTVTGVTGQIDAFEVALAPGEVVSARRVLLALGVIDQMLDLPGFAQHWGHSIFVCPFCHGWELRDRRWGVFATSAPLLPYARFLSTWAPGITVFTGGAFALSADDRAMLGGLTVDERPVRALLGGERLEAVELADGARVPIEVLFARPVQRQTPLVAGLGLDLDDLGYVKVNEQRETSRPGILAAGDLTTMMQSVAVASMAGAVAAAMICHQLALGPQAHAAPRR